MFSPRSRELIWAFLCGAVVFALGVSKYENEKYFHSLNSKESSSSDQPDTREVLLALSRLEIEVLSLRRDLDRLDSVTQLDFAQSPGVDNSPERLQHREKLYMEMQNSSQWDDVQHVELPPLAQSNDSKSVAESSLIENQISMIFLNSDLSDLVSPDIRCTLSRCRLSYSVADAEDAQPEKSEKELLFLLTQNFGGSLSTGAIVRDGSNRTFDIMID